MKQIILGFALLWSGVASAQVLSNFDLYPLDLKIINPAFTGVRHQQSFTSFGKIYYPSLSNLPSAIILSYDRQIASLKSGIGFNYRNNSTSFVTQNEFELLMSHKLEFSEEQFLSVGISPSYFSIITDIDNFNSPLDPAFSIIHEKHSSFNLSSGALYHNKGWVLAASARRIFRNNVAWGVYATKDWIAADWISIKPYARLQKGHSYFSTDIAINLEMGGVVTFGTIYRQTIYDTENGRRRESYMLYSLGIELWDHLQIFSLMDPVKYDLSGNTFEFGLRMEMTNE